MTGPDVIDGLFSIYYLFFTTLSVLCSSRDYMYYDKTKMETVKQTNVK